MRPVLIGCGLFGAIAGWPLVEPFVANRKAQGSSDLIDAAARADLPNNDWISIVLAFKQYCISMELRYKVLPKQGSEKPLLVDRFIAFSTNRKK